MKVLSALTEIGNLESEVSEFYGWLSLVFDDDSEASGFFYRLSMQERSHANLISYAKKLVHRSPRDFTDIELDLGAVEELRTMVGDFRKNNPKPPLSEVLEMAMRIESHHAEKILRSSVIQSNPKIADLMNSLAVADSEHFELLKKFVEARLA